MTIIDKAIAESRERELYCGDCDPARMYPRATVEWERKFRDALEVAAKAIDEDIKYFHHKHCSNDEFDEESCCLGCVYLRGVNTKIERILTEGKAGG